MTAKLQFCNGSNIFADHAYKTDKIKEYISKQNAGYTIPPKSSARNPWYCDYWRYKER